MTRRLIAYAAAALLMGTAPAIAGGLPIRVIHTVTGEAFDPVGKVTIVNYWATWCAPCRAELPIFDAYYRRHREEGVAMVAISLDQGASTRKLHDATHNFAFAVARIDDVRMARRDIPAMLPVTRIYDRSGKLIFQTRGDGHSTIDAATLDRILSPLLITR